MTRSDVGPPVVDLLPARPSLQKLRRVATDCRACWLYRDATQTVFGEGTPQARIMLVGEQPGDAEDKAGHPFVGPAGRLLQEALDEAGIDRNDVFITNVVKHFKFVRRGKRRIHKKPNAEEIRACVPWLVAEVGVVKPDLVVCLGATAAQAIAGPKVRVTKDRGRVIQTDLVPRVMVTVHPSSILPAPDDAARRAERAMFVKDLKGVAAALEHDAAPGRRASG